MNKFKKNAQITKKVHMIPKPSLELYRKLTILTIFSLWTQPREAALHLGLEVGEITEEEVTSPNFWASTTTVKLKLGLKNQELVKLFSTSQHQILKRLLKYRPPFYRITVYCTMNRPCLNILQMLMELS